LDKYEDWIDAYERENDVLGRCQEATEEMVKAFPELRRVPGHVETGLWGRRAHWWLTDGTRTIDPTRAQFINAGGILAYKPFVPGDKVRAGACMDCGAEIWVSVQSIDDSPPRSTFCSPACELSFIEYQR